MDISEIINEETQHVIEQHIHSLAEEVRTGRSTVPTYPYTERSEGRYVIRIDDEDRDIHTNFEVGFGRQGDTDERVYSIAFNQEGRSHSNKTGMGIQFRILSTITKIVTELVARYDPNVLTFTPIREEAEERTNKRDTNNRRLMLYMRYVNTGAGDNFDSFIFGNEVKVNVEKKDPSFPIDNGYQDPDVIQQIITDLSLHEGRYETGNIQPGDTNYLSFRIEHFGGMLVRGAENKRTGSARRFVDWMLDEPDLVFVSASAPRPSRTQQPAQPSISQQPIEPIVRTEPQAGIGSFMYFMQTEIYGYPQYDVLETYYERAKSIEDYTELRDMATERVRGLNPNDANHERLQEIISAIDRLENGYREYRDRYGDEVNEVLNEVEETLIELLK